MSQQVFDVTTGAEPAGLRFPPERQRHVAMPLGGVGAGQIALCGDGGLRQWQIANQINHVGFVPDSFFAIRASCVEPPLDTVRVLQSRQILSYADDPTPLVSDDVIPRDQLALLAQFSGVERTVFTGAYPFAAISYEDAELPIEVSLSAFSPFVPLDATASGIPAILFRFTLRNRWTHQVHGCLGASLQNAVGWDGITPIGGNACPLYGGNTNRVRHRAAATSIVMENLSLPDAHPGAGQMALAALAPDAWAYARWTTPAQFMRWIEGFNPDKRLIGQGARGQRAQQNHPASPAGASPQGQTWNGGLLVPFWLDPGESTTITFVIAWHFPNRYVNFDQFGPRRDFGKSKFWVGNAYATRFEDAEAVVEHLAERHMELEKATRAWADGLHTGTLPAWLAETFAAQGSLIRSPTCFWSEDGKFYGFEGALGRSTSMWNGSFGGSCPLNCTHVWNYEQALSRLFPALERTMRETEFEHVQAPAGYIPHRTVLPLYLPQFWEAPIGGPTRPALDGMLGAILKTYREVRQGASAGWLARLWPRVRRLVAYVIDEWDGDDDGVLTGEQPNTYDIAFFGPNMYIGGLWLAALRAAEELARLQNDPAFADALHARFACGSAAYDRLLWNGEYYIQILDESAPAHDQFGVGCLSDQLLGQWWAHQLELGYILPEAHVKTALRAIVGYNFRDGFRDFTHGYRVFADRDDAGLLICTWPRGGRPDVPVRYCDEVWTGTEYQVAAHCFAEGMLGEGLKLLQALRARYDGTRRNPYNEIECGDHYSRAMAGWSALEALAGLRYSAVDDRLAFAPLGATSEFAAPFVAGTGWGRFELRHEQDGSHAQLSASYGAVTIRTLQLAIGRRGAVAVTIDGRAAACETDWNDGQLTLRFASALDLAAGSRLVVAVDARRV